MKSYQEKSPTKKEVLPNINKKNMHNKLVNIFVCIARNRGKPNSHKVNL